MSPTRFLCASEQILYTKTYVQHIPIHFNKTYKNIIRVRQPEIKSRANAWKAFMLPLHHWRVVPSKFLIYNIYTNHKHQ